jgi:hypothetical protein
MARTLRGLRWRMLFRWEGDKIGYLLGNIKWHSFVYLVSCSTSYVLNMRDAFVGDRFLRKGGKGQSGLERDRRSHKGRHRGEDQPVLQVLEG